MKLFNCLVIIVVSLTLYTGCFDEDFVPSQQSDISFSVDTLRFDTVFTTIGSATREIKVYNRGQQGIIINSVKMGKSNSKFRLNVDGVSTNLAENINVGAGDSLYIFIEVTVDPDEPLSVSPFVITDELLLTTSDGSAKVVIEAWGQNANYFPSKNAKGQLLRLTCNNQTVVWDDPKPYVVYGLLFIDSCGLIIAPGTHVHVHGGLGILDNQVFNDGGLIFMEGGYLDVVGTLEEPVVFQGDRLESQFDGVSGQWSGIRFLSNSSKNIITHTIIENSIVGIRVDSAAQFEMSSSIIRNTSNAGLIGINSSIRAENSLIYNNAAQSIILTSGGNYEFNYMTIGNYGNSEPAVLLDNFDCLDEDCVETAIRPIKVSINNSIISGNNPDELVMTDITNGENAEVFDIAINHSLIKVEETKTEFEISTFCENCLELDNQPLFSDVERDNYQLDSLSIALDHGIPIENLIFDILGFTRDQISPDLGCYESQVY